MKVVVVGGGPAGITAAVRARRLGADVVLLERNLLGGVCYNEGPVPVRTLARAARMVRDAATWNAFGLVGEPPEVDLRAALACAKQAARHIHDVKRVDEKLRAEGIEVREEAGPVRFVDAHNLAVADGRLFPADRVILAVGGHDRQPMLPGAELGLSFADVLELKTLPARMVVIGGAATGCQLASIFADFGTHVTLIERASRLIPQEDVDLGDALGRAFAARGMDVRVDTPAERLRRIDGGVEVLLGSGQRVTGDAVFLAVGWPANLRHLALDAAGIATIGNYIHVDAQLRTSQPHIFAVGDANGIRKLMQTAAHQGRIAAENAVVDAGRAYHSGIVPSGSFTDPEYAGVGMTEEEARATGDCVVARHEYRLLTRAVVDGRVDGFCKLIADRGTGIVIGAHVMGEAAAEVVQLVAACMTTGMNVLQMAELQLAYPTYTQAVGLAALRLAQVLDLLPAGEGFDSAELSVDR